jgi:thymidylate synthase
MNNIDKQYLDLIRDILENGVEKKDRTGTGTLSVFGRQIRHKMSEGFPLLTTKKMFTKGIIGELLWFLRGETNIKWLVKNNIHIWVGDCYQAYLKKRTTSNKDNIRVPHTLKNGMSGQISRSYTQEEFINKIKTDDEFAKTWGELGPIYGASWRNWKSTSLKEQWGYGKIDGHPIGEKQYSKFNTNVHIDQIANLISELKTNPDSRRLMVSAWNVGELDQMVLPPCHYGFQVYTRELSKGERMDYWFKNNKPNRDVCDSVDESSEEEQHKYFDGANVPKRAISLIWNQRSVDTGLGLPFNIASYALLLEILGKLTNMVPDELIGNLGDTHLYLNHVEPIKEQLTREPYELPRLSINTEFWLTKSGECGIGDLSDNVNSLIKGMQIDDFYFENYKSHPTIKLSLSN